jgi:hypothetical protein
MEAIDLTNLIKEEHQGKWVVYSPSKMKIFAFDNDPVRAAKKAKEFNKEGDLRLTKILPFDQAFCPLA